VTRIQKFTTFEDTNGINLVEFVVADSPDPNKRTKWIEARTDPYMPLDDSNVWLRYHALKTVKDELEKIIAVYDRKLPKAE
jgi:hypothetical protein